MDSCKIKLAQLGDIYFEDFLKTTFVKVEKKKIGRNNLPKIKNMRKTKALFLWKKLFRKAQNIWFVL